MPKTRRDLQNELIRKAMTDNAFKQELINDPKSTISKFIGGNLPADVKITVVQETPDTYYLVLPAAPPAGTTFSDEHLEKFASFDKGTGATAIQLGICC
jgi:hypothetical protein